MTDPTTTTAPRPRPAVRGRVTERIVTEIRAYITANELRPGHRLPPERVFIDQLGVSRSSLREALRVLATIGLIEVRHGDGMYVAAQPEAWQPSPAAIFDATEQDALRNLVETRLGVELAATIAATARVADEDLDQLQRYLDEQSRRLEADPDHEWEPLAFELALVELTGNGWLHDIEVMLRDAWLELSGGLRSSVGRHREWLSEHHAILASVRSRNAAQAQRLVIAHLNLERFEHDLRSRRTGR
ncbi:MAG TPA: GntR family transcriptional regulator [Pseudonocardiaceae bacterium]|nr:GntR family transcriptional regulator [Pseudonocardiaceae bacterium]